MKPKLIPWGYPRITGARAAVVVLTAPHKVEVLEHAGTLGFSRVSAINMGKAV